jgi:hypothetical protein
VSQPLARYTTAGTGEAYWFFDSLMVIRADQPGQPVIIEARAVGQPALSRTLPPGGLPASGMDAAFDAAARTGQPVIGPPMSDEEAALIAA